MIDWATIRPVLLAVCAERMGIHSVWRDRNSPFVPPLPVAFGVPVVAGAIARLSLGPAAQVGRDEKRTREVETVLLPGPPPVIRKQLEDRVISTRLVTLKVLVECTDQGDGRTADFYLEKLRSSFRFDSVRERILSVNVAFVEAFDIFDLSMLQDDRMLSAMSMDVRLSVVGEDIDPVRYEYIETVAPITGTLTQ